MIELCNKRAFSILAQKPCNSAVFTVLQKKKKFRFLWTGKTKNIIFNFNLWKRELGKENCHSVCLFLSNWLTLWWRACVSCVVSGVVSVKVCKGAKCGLFRVPRVYVVLPAPIVIYGMLCVRAFLDRRSICGSKGVCVLRELRRVNLYTVQDADLSIRRVFIVFLFSYVVQ